MWKLKTAPTTEPVTLEEAKLHLKIDSDTTDDTLVTALIQAAREQAEKYLNRALISQTWEYALDVFPKESISVPVTPLASVTSITYTDTAGSTQTLSTSVYGVDTIGDTIYLKADQVWPSVQDVTNAILITYVAGYGAAANVPASIKAAILLIIGDLYEHRHENITGASVAQISRSAASLLDPYRVFA